MTSANASFEGTYSYVDALGATVPEIQALINQAASEKWDSTRFADALQATDWWKTNSSTARQMTALQATQPAEWSQQYNAALQHVSQIAQQQGVQLSNDQIAQFTIADLYQGLDDATLTSQIGRLYQIGTVNAGTSVNYEQQLRQMAASYGVPVTDQWIQQQIQTSLGQNTGLEGAKQSLINMASSAYPSLAQQLQSGQTVSDIAQPYMAAMSQILEVPSTGITLQDPTIQRALTNSTLALSTPGKASTSTSSSSSPGTPGQTSSASTSSSTGTNQPGDTTMPLWQFQDQLRQDPRWQQTDNAKASAYSMAASLGKQWGFAS